MVSPVVFASRAQCTVPSGAVVRTRSASARTTSAEGAPGTIGRQETDRMLDVGGYRSGGASQLQRDLLKAYENAL